MNFKILIFDLDDTLLDTTGLLLQRAVLDSCQTLVEGGLNASISSAAAYWIEHNDSRNIFEELVDHFGLKLDFSNENCRSQLIQAGKKQFYERPVPAQLPLMPGAREILDFLKTNHRLFLVTLGNAQTQQAKVNALGIHKDFQKIIYITLGEKKSTGFREILQETKTSPENILIIGNRLDNEIEDGHRLGCKTCWFKYGEHSTETPKNQFQVPQFTITKLGELRTICQP